MRLRIPVYIESRKTPEGIRYNVRPLFFPAPVRDETSLSKAMSKFTQELSRDLGQLGRQGRQHKLAEWTFGPKLAQHKVDVTIELRRKVIRARFFFVMLKALGRKIAFSPAVPDLWFDLRRGETLAARASEVFSAHFRQREKEEEEDFLSPEHLALKGTAWVTPVELDVSLGFKPPPLSDNRFAFLGGPPVADGAVELARVGRCLNWHFGELDRVVGREREVAELEHWLTSDDMRPVLLVGPRLVGKTAIIHEYVHQATAARATTYTQSENVWLLSPQRLVSGMSYVGQWEQRLLAILKVARRRKHALYFDDLLGLFHAGVSRDSSLSMAHVLKPYLERREFRLLAEITPEALSVLRERDRGLADLFHVIPVAEPDERETWRILVGVVRRLEEQHRSKFQLDALPAAIDFQRRYVRDGAFPGKGARFLEQLAVQSPGQFVARDHVIHEFHSQSGLCLTFLDPRRRLARKEIVQALAAQVIGQPGAIEAVADVLSIAKARLNDPTRPLASLLFLGPTGVGKTECAKALARYLFGDAERMLRFDMNEYVGAGSAARLVGTFAHPEGLLTSAVRRQPFAVILLDEIEKAHPEVFDVLLQVLGEGRLTDALGRTVDFTNTIVILTSNLGVREAAVRLGFQTSASGEEQVAFARAAEKFFRPEFFNRLDRIVPFGHLSREHVERIARLVIQDVFARDGLTRRRCMLHVEDQTLDRVVTMGYSPRYGARALKRSIERQLTQPVADQLSVLRPETPTLVRLYPGEEGIAVRLEPLVDAPQTPGSLAEVLDVRKTLGPPREVLQRVEEAIERIEAAAESLRPKGAVTVGQIAPEHLRYYALHEQLLKVRESCEKALDRLRPRKTGGRTLPSASTQPRGSLKSQGEGSEWNPKRGHLLAEMTAAQDMHEYLRELSQAVVAPDRTEEEAREVVRQAALLETIHAAVREPRAESVLLHIRPFESGGPRFDLTLTHVHGRLAELLALEMEYVDVSEPKGRSLPVVAKNPGAAIPLETRMGRGPLGFYVLHGAHALPVAELEQGTHLFCPKQGALIPVQVIAVPLATGETPIQAYARHLETRVQWLAERAVGKATLESDPFRLRPVIRVYEEGGPSIDVRTSLVGGFIPTSTEMAHFLMSAMTLPGELLGP